MMISHQNNIAFQASKTTSPIKPGIEEMTSEDDPSQRDIFLKDNRIEIYEGRLDGNESDINIKSPRSPKKNTNANDTGLSLSPKKTKELEKDANGQNSRSKHKGKGDKDEYKRQKTEAAKTNKNHLKPKHPHMRSESRGSSVDRNSDIDSKISSGNYLLIASLRPSDL